MIISHIKKVGAYDWLCQSNEEHSEGVADMAASFADEFGFRDIGRLLGLLHDKGKEQRDFQTYIKKVSGMAPDLIMKSHPNHAYIGALIANCQYPSIAQLLCNPIMGHHAGLYDSEESDEILRKDIPQDVDKKLLHFEWKRPMPASKPEQSDFNHVIRMLFSCLADADFLDTERFMDADSFAQRGNSMPLQQLQSKLDDYLLRLRQDARDTELNRIRDDIQNICRGKAEELPGFYSLTVPTGGGKTLASLIWAMNHAVRYGKKRIIIAIPYTSIIVQTADILRTIFGDDNVLEHHSLADCNEETEKETHEGKYSTEKRLATENWDYPIVVTTNVRLFESMYSCRPSHCRKLHNICNSVLILDEVQTLGTDFLQSIVNGLKTYQRLFGVSVLFTTASMPVLSGIHIGTNPKVKFKGIDSITEIVPEKYSLHDKLRRVCLHFDEKSSCYDDIAGRMAEYGRVLCVVNTRKDAYEVYRRLPDEGVTLHLSKMMCPRHISNTIATLRAALEDDTHQIVRLVSTQLIEAGVDIDFPVVFRQEAGLDSILQAAGRCNREGRIEMGHAYVFRFAHPLPRGFITQTNNAREGMMKLVEDKFSPEAIRQYFLQLYSRVITFDRIGVGELLEETIEPAFRTIGDRYRLISDDMISVVVNYGNAAGLIEKLKSSGPTYSLMKQLGQYSVNVRPNVFNDIKGLAEEIYEGIYFISDTAQYDESVGLITTNHLLDDILTI